MLACLPIMVIHTLAVSLSSYRLVRRVQKQNRQLEALNRRDALTGVQSRGFWEQQAQALLRQSQADGGAATLLLLDADEFKRVNDCHGHGVGDDALCAIADLLRRRLPAGSHAGRLGGDEFVVALPVAMGAAARVAESVRAEIEALAFPRTPGLCISVSIGLAAAPGPGLDLREWIEAADRALYRAKHAGRNRVADDEATSLPKG
jgi:diguanylate cyclase